MSQTIIEHLRKEAINHLFSLDTVQNCWSIWKAQIQQQLPDLNAINVLDLGDHLSNVFRSTGGNGRGQGEVSGGGTAWEALICWYMNLCLLESRTVVVKFKKRLIPTPIREALIVSYGASPTSTESDLVAITFPEKEIYAGNKLDIVARDHAGQIIPTTVGRNRFNYEKIIDSLADIDFSDYEVGVIQCKTNWNDSAQIPMLWDMVYASEGFSRNQISVGTSAYKIRNLRKFSYSFVTVPTNKGSFTQNTLAVKRVQNISGGNYWGQASQPGVVYSVKEIFGRNFSSSTSIGTRATLNAALPKLSQEYSYFDLI
ncbi:hypothetical protein [Heliorestis convoluta]|uniref:Uncharacterized protein n=1 Tax=Heliorestis convoluta TaxID=356322 RepID=A0A5Q2MXU4_9FIRM|nr:hypothetical protein [Heliorestis convoluta]QGG47634.1 hypothetical protein FTV88_1534 [Heliorestis convoluta]